MATIKLTNEQLRLIQKSLDFYSRIGTLQFEEILRQPTIENLIINRFRPKKSFEVGDQTDRGIIVEIGRKKSTEFKNDVNDNIKYIKTKGYWNTKEEVKKWTDIKNIKLSTNYNQYHQVKDEIEKSFNEIKEKISGEHFGSGGNLGIYNRDVDKSCVEAYDLVQLIRHEFWKEDPNRSLMTVDSSLHLSTVDADDVEVKLDTIKDIREKKLKKLSK